MITAAGEALVTADVNAAESLPRLCMSSKPCLGLPIPPWGWIMQQCGVACMTEWLDKIAGGDHGRRHYRGGEEKKQMLYIHFGGVPAASPIWRCGTKQKRQCLGGSFTVQLSVLEKKKAKHKEKRTKTLARPSSAPSWTILGWSDADLAFVHAHVEIFRKPEVQNRPHNLTFWAFVVINIGRNLMVIFHHTRIYDSESTIVLSAGLCVGWKPRGSLHFNTCGCTSKWEERRANVNAGVHKVCVDIIASFRGVGR